MDQPRITNVHGLFGSACRVDVNVQARPDCLWKILSNLPEFPRWNSAVTSIDGEIREGGRLSLKIHGSDRVFTPTISGVVPNKQMTWSGGGASLFRDMLNFKLTPQTDGSTDVSMEERYSGLFAPLFEGPDFGPILERFANDLKREAERGA